MSKSGLDYRTKRLLSPESVGLTSSVTPYEKKLKQFNLIDSEVNPLLPEMSQNELVPRDLQSWMATISAHLKLTTNKADLEELATKTDLLKMNDTIVAQSRNKTNQRGITTTQEGFGQYEKQNGRSRGAKPKPEV